MWERISVLLKKVSRLKLARLFVILKIAISSFVYLLLKNMIQAMDLPIRCLHTLLLNYSSGQSAHLFEARSALFEKTG